MHWMDWNPAGVFGSHSGVVSGILSSAHLSIFAVYGGAWVTNHALAAWYTHQRSSEVKRVDMIPTGLVAVYDVGQGLYYSLWFL
jgi:hypothetical protein